MGFFSKSNIFRKVNIVTVILWFCLLLNTVCMGFVLGAVGTSVLPLVLGGISYAGVIVLMGFAISWYREKEIKKMELENLKKEKGAEK